MLRRAIVATVLVLAVATQAIIITRNNVRPGALPSVLASGVADFHFIQVGGGTAGALGAAELAKSGCFKVLVLDEGPEMDDLNPYNALHPGMEYASDGYYSNVWDRTYIQRNGAIDPDTYKPNTIRDVPGGAQYISHYAWECGNPAIHDAAMQAAFYGSAPSALLSQNLFVNVQNRYLNFSGPHIAANHANQGPFRIQESREEALEREWRAACVQFTGNANEYDFNRWCNGSDRCGARNTCGAEPSNLRADGFRSTTGREFLIPEALRNPNLVVIRDTAVHRVLFDGNEAIGVEGTFNGVRFSIRFPARITLPPRNVCPQQSIQDLKQFRRVVLATGTIATAKLLLLSGVGDPDTLESFGIKVNVPNPEVGKNFREGYVSYTGWSMNATAAEAGYLFEGNDWTSSRPGAFVNINGTNYMLLLTPSIFDVYDVAYALVFQLEQPNAGSVTLRSANPGDHPVIDVAWDQSTIDLHVVGNRYFRALIKSTGLQQRFNMQQYFPAVDSDDYDVLADGVRKGGEAILHNVGTAAFGRVTNAQFGVIGAENLDVYSMAVYPYFPGAGGQCHAVGLGASYAAAKRAVFGL